MRRSLAPLAAFLLLAPALAAATETWMTVRLDGRKVGHAKMVRQADADRVTTSQVMALRLARGKQPFLTQSDITTVESTAGAPLSFVARTQSSAEENHTEAFARGDGTFQLATTVGGAQKVDIMTWPVGASMGEGQRLAILRHGFRPGTTYAMQDFDTVRQRVVHMDITVVGDEMVDLPGGREALHHLRESPPGQATGPSIDAWVNDTGMLRRSTSPLLGFQMEMAACDEACANAPDQDLDVLRTAMVQSPRLISAAMREEPIRYTLSYRGKGPSPFIDTNEQQVTRIGDGLYEMLVTAPRKTDDTPPPTADDLAPTAWVQSTAPEIVALAAEAVGNAKTDVQRMRRLRSFVTDYITGEGLGVGYASALETVRTRHGDCTEYAVLLAAMARAQGIPTRIATGLIYADRFASASRMFVPHTWDQAWIDGRWVSFDASARQFDATHIALSVGNGDPWRFFSIMSLFADIRIQKAISPTQPTMGPERPPIEPNPSPPSYAAPSSAPSRGKT